MVTNRRIMDDQLYVHFVTFSVDIRRKLVDHDHPQRILLGVLNDLMERGLHNVLVLSACQIMCMPDSLIVSCSGRILRLRRPERIFQGSPGTKFTPRRVIDSEAHFVRSQLLLGVV
ncbi:MAG TPA: hypothetical protein DD473_22770 [Planctomycetaceae bacterium]|nr:hypothetical protein [Planctomycetaceae bacterium]